MMHLFGGSKRPELDGLTKEEEKRRNELTSELIRRSNGQDAETKSGIGLELLRSKCTAQRNDFLWPLLLGRQLMNTRHYTDAIDTFNVAVGLNPKETRSHCGAGMAYFQAGKAAASLGAGVTDAMVPVAMSAEDLFRKAKACFETALTLTLDKAELEAISNAKNEVTVALARSW
jgi:hypothetical protein